MMPFDWREFIGIAGVLYAGGGPMDQESARRSAVSRAYYAAFCHVRNHAQQNFGFRPSYEARDHGALTEILRRRRDMRTPGQLARLRGWRNSCDYDNDVTGLDSMTPRAIELARDIVQRF
jgi:hypothetical protein